MGILNGIGVYFIVGVVAIGLLDLITKRIRHRIRDASYETQSRLMDGVQMRPGIQMSMLITAVALWVFWLPVVLGALYDWLRGGSNGKKE